MAKKTAAPVARNIMREFKINEISAVDEPAQSGARVAFMKRAEPVAKESTLVHVEVCDEDDHEDDAVDDGPAPITDTMQETAMTPEEKIAQLEAQLKDAEAKLAEMEAASKGKALVNAAGGEDAVAAAAEELDAATKTDEYKAAAAKSANPDVAFVTDDGTVILKSQDPTGLIAKMAKERDEDRKALRTEIAKRKVMELAKRAGAELSHLPGIEDHKVALLAAVGGISDEGVRKGVTEMLKANDAGISEALKKRGTTGAGADTAGPESKLESMTKAKMAAEKISYAKAYGAVLASPEGSALYAQIVTPTAVAPQA